MKAAQRLTAIIEREDDGFVALCPELDIASEGASIEEARNNLIDVLTLFFRRSRRSKSQIGGPRRIHFVRGCDKRPSPRELKTYLTGTST